MPGGERREGEGLSRVDIYRASHLLRRRLAVGGIHKDIFHKKAVAVMEQYTLNVFVLCSHASVFHLPSRQELFAPASQQCCLRVGSKTQPCRRIAGGQAVGPLHEAFGAGSIGEGHQRGGLCGASFVRAASKQSSRQPEIEGMIRADEGKLPVT